MPPIIIILCIIILILLCLIVVGRKNHTNLLSTKQEVEQEKQHLKDIKSQQNQVNQNLTNCIDRCKILNEQEEQLTQKCKERQQEIIDDFSKLKADKERLLAAEYEIASRDYASKQEIVEEQLQTLNSLQEAAQAEYEQKIKDWDTIYIGLIEPFRKMEEEKDARTAYCLSMSESDTEDIQFLLQEVAPKVKNKDLIPKLVWGEYVQKPLAALLTKYKITELPGIYKLTNINDDKAYIGKSVNVKKRIQDHFKAACGISSISDQKIHHAMLEQGLDNWQVEVVCYCPKDELGEKEKFYIEKFGTQTYGWNIASGG